MSVNINKELLPYNAEICLIIFHDSDPLRTIASNERFRRECLNALNENVGIEASKVKQIDSLQSLFSSNTYTRYIIYTLMLKDRQKRPQKNQTLLFPVAGR